MPSFLRSLVAPLFLLAISSAVVGQSGNETSFTTVPIDELAQVYQDTILQFPFFPPTEDLPDSINGTSPVQVVVSMQFTSIDTILPGESEFAVSYRISVFWNKAACSQTVTHQQACSPDSGLRFIGVPPNIKEIPETTFQAFFEDPNAGVYEQQGLTDLQPDLAMVEQKAIFAKTFNVRYYPYEYHELEFVLNSFYSTDFVEFTNFPGVDPASLNPSVPAGWVLEDIVCEPRVTSGDRVTDDLSGGTFSLSFAQYHCVVAVSRTTPGWWWTSFLLFVCLIAIVYLGTVGLLSRMVSEARDDKDAARSAMFTGTRLDGTFTIGLLLTYVFQVELSPYGQPIEYWPETPTSTYIYVLGLLAIVLQACSGLFASLLFPVQLTADGFVGAFKEVYAIDRVPLETENPEDNAPLRIEPPPPVRENKIDEPEETQPMPGKAPRTRRANTKTYNILSVEEAETINNFVRQLFLFKSFIFVTVFVIAAIILGHSSTVFKNSATV